MLQRSASPQCTSSWAFTLVEILITIAIIGTLAVLITAAAKGALNSVAIAKGASNLKQIAAQGLLYAADNEMQLPGKTGMEMGQLQWDLDILRTWDPIADPAATAGAPERLAAELRGKVFSNPLDDVELEFPADIRRSYVMNCYLVNLSGSYPAYPGAPINTPARLNMIPTLSKVWFFGDGFRPWNAGLGKWYGHIWGTPQSFKSPDWITVAFLDGHVERINMDKMTVSVFWDRHSNPQTAVNN